MLSPPVAARPAMTIRAAQQPPPLAQWLLAGAAPTVDPAPQRTAVAFESGEGVLWVRRMSAWLAETAMRLHPALSRLCAACANSSWRARLALVDTLRAWLVRCALSLQPCVPALLEHLYAATRDQYPQVASAAVRALDAVCTKLAAPPPRSRRSFETDLRHSYLIIYRMTQRSLVKYNSRIPYDTAALGKIQFLA